MQSGEWFYFVVGKFIAHTINLVIKAKTNIVKLEIDSDLT